MGKPVGDVKSLLVKSLSYGILVFFILLCVYFNSRTDGLFLSDNNILNILQQTAINTIIAVGMTFVIISGGIDLSVGAILSMSGVLSMTMLLHGFGRTHAGPADTAWPLLLAIPAAAITSIVIGGLCGAFSGVFITKLRVTPFIATLAMMSIARGYAYVFTDARPVSPLPSAFFEKVGGYSIHIGSLSLPPLVPLALLVVIGGYIVLSRTPFGRNVYAIGGNEEAARLSGINIDRTKLGVYAISGLLAGLSGFMLAARLASGDPKAGNMYEMNAIAAVVLGGTSLMGGKGSVTGTLLGALVIGSLEIGLVQTGVSTYYQMMVKGGVILLAVVLDQLKVRLSDQTH